MKGLVKSELIKLRSTRTTYYLLAAIVALSAITVLDGVSADSLQKPFDEQPFVFFTTMLTRVLILVFGIRLITDEFRHGSIVPTLMASPRRGQVLSAKVIVAAVGGLLAGALAGAVMTGATMFVASAEKTTLTLDADVWVTLIGMAGAGVVWATMGVFVGAIVRHQLAATIGGLLWLMAIEDIVNSLLGDLGGYLPGQAGIMLVLTPDGVSLGTVLATLAAYLATFGFLATRSMRRDIA